MVESDATEPAGDNAPIGGAGQAPQSGDQDVTPTTAEGYLVPLAPAGPLLLDGANEVASDKPTFLTVLVGDAESGKTTLIACVYINLLNGPFGAIRFGGSRTLFAFEDRAFLALARSGLHEATTRRTLYTERQTFLHLVLARDDGEHAPLLVGDMSGEYFDRAVDNAAELTKIGFMKRADHLAVIIDGAKATDATTRQVARSRMRQLVRRLLENNIVPPRGLQIVVSKWDKVVSAGDSAIAFVDAQVAEFEVLATRFNVSAEIFRTAARSETPDGVPAGFGVYELLMSWLARAEPNVVEPPAPELSKPFDRFNPT